MDFVETACIVALYLRLRKNRRRRFRAHPSTSSRLLNSQFSKLFRNLCEQECKFFNYLRISKASFDKLLEVIGPRITHEDTNMRLAVPPEERLAVTLRYLTTGNTFIQLHHEYHLGVTTLRKIVRETCDVLWEFLSPTFMPQKDTKDWLKIAEEFHTQTNFPNCIGAVYGKHIKIKKPYVSGSDLADENCSSVVLMAVTDADNYFTSIEVMEDDPSNNYNIFKKSKFGTMLATGQLKTPIPNNLPGDDDGTAMPYVLVGDEAFGLSSDVLRPYGNRDLTVLKKIFNLRLSKARRMADVCFRILTSKFQILFLKPLDVSTDFCYSIVKACCILHNYIRKNDGITSEDTLYTCPLENLSSVGVRSTIVGVETRDYFAQYFTSPQGSVPWQYEKI